ncbi:hypothetical protein [Paenibacillus anseongense]|uniref:hypothetical protein n=1 Tax=Paenibacillus TaxID=44249 RepID=UPI002DBA6A1D|nr:hypothetical protein [Paenibacillus anseongense]MEC0264523.1 hypothetical protein [Paenibacillus anseongense]
MTNLNSVMNLIKEKPSLYLGKKSITRLLGFITGFSHAEYVYKIIEDNSMLFPLPFHFFHEFVSVKLGYFESTSGWYNMIFKKNNHDEETSFDEFFQLYEEFINIKIQTCESAILTEENKHFLIHDQFTPKRVVGFDERGNSLVEPCFSAPEQLFLIGISNNLGYIRVIMTKKDCILVFKFSKEKKKSKEYFHKYFGDNLSWIKDEWKDEILNNREISYRHL